MTLTMEQLEALVIRLAAIALNEERFDRCDLLQLFDFENPEAADLIEAETNNV